ncbi:hypothetical protein AX16_000911 [Volvariella volvacea WC 439]|nr:hypothetical protein AX16_000911 [Volvariella volvacea WC 439]
MNQYVTNPEAVTATVTQIHDWIRESPANWDQVLNHFAVLHAQGDPLDNGQSSGGGPLTSQGQ